MKLNFKVILSTALVLALLFFLLGSALSPIYESGHVCLHSSCTVCILISSIRALSDMIGVALFAAAVLAFADLLGARICDDRAIMPRSLFTPVSLKDKLSD